MNLQCWNIDQRNILDIYEHIRNSREKCALFHSWNPEYTLPRWLSIKNKFLHLNFSLWYFHPFPYCVSLIFQILAVHCCHWMRMQQQYNLGIMLDRQMLLCSKSTHTCYYVYYREVWGVDTKNQSNPLFEALFPPSSSHSAPYSNMKGFSHVTGTDFTLSVLFSAIIKI